MGVSGVSEPSRRVPPTKLTFFGGISNHPPLRICTYIHKKHSIYIRLHTLRLALCAATPHPAGAAAEAPGRQPVDYANLFIGTSNSRWMLGPYAQMPFGMVQLGPDNRGDVWMGGYEYSIANVSDFSHLHA